MLEALNTQLADLQDRRRMLQKLQKDEALLKRQLYDAGLQLDQIQLQQNAESAAARKLRRFGFVGLFHRLMGNRRERMDECARRIVKLQLQQDEHSDSMREMQRELEAIQLQVNAVGNLDQEHEELMRAKERAIADRAGPLFDQLTKLAEQAGNLRADVRELQEAIAAGESAEEALREVHTLLGSAANWGVFDILGGDLIATVVKHNKLNSARQLAHRAQQRLRNLDRELGDIGSRLDANISVGSFLTFADYFFDGLISDLMVQSRINKSRGNVEEVLAQVRLVQNDLSVQLHRTNKQLKEVETSRRQQIESA